MVGIHEGGHLPFHLPISPSSIVAGQPNRVTVALNNTLSTTSIPPGFLQTNAAGRTVQKLQMDFFHYAGLHRQVGRADPWLELSGRHHVCFTRAGSALHDTPHLP